MLKKITLITLCGLFVAVAAFAQDPPELMEEIVKRTAADGEAGDYFGDSVAVSGDVAIAGAPHADDESGSAYIFERDQGGSDNWGQVDKIIAIDTEADDLFGNSVAVSGDVAVIGAPWDDDAGGGSGSAYVFTRDQNGAGNWSQVAKLTADDAAAGDRFGDSVAVSGDIAVIGAFHTDDAGAGSGSAYVFERDQGGSGNWGQVAELTADDAEGSDYFGASVSVNGDTVIATAHRNDDAGSESGSAYVFGRDQGGPDNWGQVDKITADDAAAGDRFGSSVSLSGAIAIIGAYRGDAGDFSGSAYVFERDQGGPDNWGQVTKITADDATAEASFGTSVSLNGAIAVIGARRDDAAGDNSGSAYVFERNQGGPDNWGQVAKITAADTVADDYFGKSVSLSGDTAIVGAYYDDDAGDNSGSAYVFRFTGPLVAIPTAIFAAVGAPVDVPVELTTNGRDLASLAFSVDYDETCLSFDPADGDADGVPDAVDFPLGASFSSIVFFDLGDADGELDFVLFANDPTTTTFPDGTLATITLTATCSGPGDSITAPVTFSSYPAPSFGDPDAQAVVGTSVGGSVEVLASQHGDCNFDSMVSSPDLTAGQLEIFDGDGDFWTDTLNAIPFRGSPVGCDANDDTLIDAGDLSCAARLIFDIACGGALRSPPSEGPRLSLPAELSSEAGGVVAAITFEPRGAAVNSLTFSLDYDQDRLIFDDLPGAVRFLGTPVSQRSLSFDAGDTDGELDVVVADFTTTRVLSEGLLVEVDLRLLDPGAAMIDGGVIFSVEPPASFGDVEGRSVPGTAEVDRGPQEIFADGFESGDTLAWIGIAP